MKIGKLFLYNSSVFWLVIIFTIQMTTGFSALPVFAQSKNNKTQPRISNQLKRKSVSNNKKQPVRNLVVKDYRGKTVFYVQSQQPMFPQRGVPISFTYNNDDTRASMTDASGTTSYTYDGFGILINRSGTTPNNYLYAGEQFDSDLGLYYNRARYLDTSSGRFWTADKYEGNKFDPRSLHQYTYAHNNPINASDPTGNVTVLELVVGLHLANVLRTSDARTKAAIGQRTLTTSYRTANRLVNQRLTANNREISREAQSQGFSGRFGEHEYLRRELGLPNVASRDNRTTLAKFEHENGVRSWGTPGQVPRQFNFQRTNSTVESHAEGNALREAQLLGKPGDFTGTGRIIVDREPCPGCLADNGLKEIIKQMGMKELEIIWPAGRHIIKP